MTTYAETVSGTLLDLRAPAADLVFIDDIARSLAKVARFNGHIDRLYTTATHCCLLSDWVLEQDWGDRQKALLMLLHHGVDVYISDIPFSVRAVVPEIKPLKEAIERCVAVRFDMEWPWPQWLLDGNIRIIKHEMAIMTAHSREYIASLSDLPAIEVEFPDWSCDRSEEEFLMRFRRLTGVSDQAFQTYCSGARPSGTAG